MERLKWTTGVVTTSLLFCGTLSLAVESRYEACESIEDTASSAGSSEGAALELLEPQRHASFIGASQDSDADRGCCVWKTKDVNCAYANRGYCRTKAEELGVTYEFFMGESCRDVRECPQQVDP